MKGGIFWLPWLAFAAWSVLSGAAWAAPEGRPETGSPLAVGVYVSPPFVMPTDEGAFQDLAVELWETASKPLEITSKYIQYYRMHDSGELAVMKNKYFGPLSP